MLYNKTKLFKEFGHYIIAIEKTEIRDNKQFALRNKETIINERNDRNWNIEIF